MSSDDNFIPIADVVTEDDYILTEDDGMSTEDDHDDYLLTDEDDDDDDRNKEHVVDLDLLKISAEDFKKLPSEQQRVHWLAAHLVLKKFDYCFKKKESKEQSKVEQVSKDKEVVEESREKVVEEEEQSKVEQVSKDKEEESKEEEEESIEKEEEPKTDDDVDGGWGPRGASWKRSNKPHV